MRGDDKVKKPEPLNLDGEVFKIYDHRNNPDMAIAYISGAKMNLSPYEAEKLRDWLNNFLEWYYQERE